MRPTALVLTCLLAVFGWSNARASEDIADGFHPSCGSPGDLVFVQGAGLGAESDVRFGSRLAAVVRARADVLLCRVPEGIAEGRIQLSVGGNTLRDPFFVLARGSPVIHGTSADVATPGQTLLLHGRRLQGGAIEFVDEHAAIAGRTTVVGGRRVVMARVPTKLAPGRYRVRLTNRLGLSTKHSLPNLEVRASGPRRCSAVGSGLLCPGRRVLCVGAELAPLGSCELRWQNKDGRVWGSPGWSNGYDRISTVVPHGLRADRWYYLRLAPPGGTAVGMKRVFVRASEAPARLELDTASAAAGSIVGLQGMTISGLGGVPEVRLTQGKRRVAARTLYRHPGGLGHGRSWLLRLPDSLAPGEHRVSARVEEAVVDAGVLRVTEAATSSADPAR